MTYYGLAKDMKYNHRFDDITVKSSTQARKDGGNPTSDATRFNNVVSIEEIMNKKKAAKKSSSKKPAKSTATTAKANEKILKGQANTKEPDVRLKEKPSFPWKGPKEQPGTMMRGFSQFGASSNSSLGQNASFINNGSVGLSKQPSTYAVQKQSAAPGANKSAAAAAAASTNRNVISTSSSGAVKPATSVALENTASR